MPSMEEYRLDYAWKWFEYHADQRVKMFNFMLIALGVFANAIVNAIDADIDYVPAALCFIAAGVVIVFHQLDRRNQELIWVGEDVLAHLERSWLFEPPTTIAPIHGKPRLVTYGLLRRIENDPQLHAPEGLRGVLRRANLGQHRFWIKGGGKIIALLLVACGVYLAVCDPHPNKSADTPPNNNLPQDPQAS